MIITGIGSRETPTEFLERMNRLAIAFARAGWLLRSGGADGADMAFEEAFRSQNGKMEIYLPWKNFNDNPSPLYDVCDRALEMASTIHPAWHNCSQGARLLHGRNCYQVLGKNLNDPSDVVVCWTKDGKPSGGTRTAILLAKSRIVPVINLATDPIGVDDWIIQNLGG